MLPRSSLMTPLRSNLHFAMFCEASPGRPGLDLLGRRLRSGSEIRRNLLLLGLFLYAMRRVKGSVSCLPFCLKSLFWLILDGGELFLSSPNAAIRTDDLDRLGESLENSFERWDVIFLKIAESHPSFVVYLSERLVDTLVFDPANDSLKRAQAETLFLWLEHLITSPTWEPHRSFCPRSYILAACSENPNHWAKLLLDRLREHQDSTSVVSGTNTQHSKKSAVYHGSDAAHSSVAEKLREYGWEPVEKWDTRPLGIASTS